MLWTFDSLFYLPRITFSKCRTILAALEYIQLPLGQFLRDFSDGYKIWGIFQLASVSSPRDTIVHILPESLLNRQLLFQFRAEYSLANCVLLRINGFSIIKVVQINRYFIARPHRYSNKIVVWYSSSENKFFQSSMYSHMYCRDTHVNWKKKTEFIDQICDFLFLHSQIKKHIHIQRHLSFILLLVLFWFYSNFSIERKRGVCYVCTIYAL